MIRWPLRRSRGNSNDTRVPVLTGSGGPKKSILRTKGSENDLYTTGRGYYNSSTSMIDIRAPNTPMMAGSPIIYDSVTSDFLGGRSAREKRSVLFLDQLVGGRQASLDGANSNSGNSNSERQGGGPAPSFSSYPASYQPSPITVRRENDVPGIELISKSVIISRRDSFEGANGDSNSTSSRFTLRPSLPWIRKKTKKTDNTVNLGSYSPNSSRVGSRQTDRENGTIASSTNLRLDYGPIDKLALDKSILARTQYSAYNNTVSGSCYNAASKPPLPVSTRDVISPTSPWNSPPRDQDTRVNNNSWSTRADSSSTSRHRLPRASEFTHFYSGPARTVRTELPSPPLDTKWVPYKHQEVYMSRPPPSGEQPPQIISRPRMHNSTAELPQFAESRTGTGRLRRRVSLAYAPVTPLLNGRVNGLPGTSTIVTPEAPRVIEINRR